MTLTHSEHQRHPFAVDTKEAARLCSVSERHFIKLNDEDLLGPKPVRLGTCVRWNVDELRAWLKAGCPHRERWEAICADHSPSPADAVRSY